MKAAERQAQAISMRKAGATYKQIGQELGITAMGAFKAVEVGLDKTLRESSEGLRELEVQRCETLMRGIWSKAIAGDVQAVDRALKISERIARLLGLDAPVKTEVTGPGGGPVQSIAVTIPVELTTPQRLGEIMALIEKHHLIEWMKPRMQEAVFEVKEKNGNGHAIPLPNPGDSPSSGAG